MHLSWNLLGASMATCFHVLAPQVMFSKEGLGIESPRKMFHHLKQWFSSITFWGGGIFSFPMAQDPPSSQVLCCGSPRGWCHVKGTVKGTESGSAGIQLCSNSLLLPAQVGDARARRGPEVWADPGSVLPGQHPPHEGADEAGTDCLGPSLWLGASSQLLAFPVLQEKPGEGCWFWCVLEVPSTCGSARALLTHSLF